MGTSSRWSGPSGRAWTQVRRRLNAQLAQPHVTSADFDAAAEDYVHVLQETLCGDPTAYGLRDAACAAGIRLAEAIDALAEHGPQTADAFIAQLSHDVGGDGATITDAAVRRAAAAAAREVLKRHPELKSAPAQGRESGGLASDILCDLFQLFFALVVAEFLKSVIAAHIALAMPLVHVLDPAGKIPDLITEKLLSIVPNPCEAAQQQEAEEIVQAVQTAQDLNGMIQQPALVLPVVARLLVPRAVRTVLGLAIEEGEAAA